VTAHAASLPTAEELHARYKARIDRRVTAVLGRDDEREDLVQEVLATVLRRIGTVRDPACLDGWVAQVTMNSIRYELRRRRYRRLALGRISAEKRGASFLAAFDATVVAARAMSVMHRLSPMDGALLSAHWFDPVNLESIAAAAGCSVSTTRRRLTKARARFKKLARRDPALAQRMVERVARPSPAAAPLG
jgi:RNA polymerase sigma-70 factor (ECF subfamily)